MSPSADISLPIYLESVLALSNDAIAIVNTEGVVLYWNEQAEKIYSISQHDILGQTISEFFQQEDLMVLRILKNPYPVSAVYHRPRPDTHVLINASPLYDKKHQLIGAISVEQNISQIVKLNDELTETSSLLDELKHQVNQQHPKGPFAEIKGRSSGIKDAIQTAAKVAPTQASILITGESGVGKELFARAIHASSTRKDNPFIPINCGAIPAALFESELFGYESGAFTGAAKEGKRGKLEMADGGTLFLDEVGELPMDMQVKLLRVLQEQEFYRVGGTSLKKVNVRIITATNRDLAQFVKEKRFREDLYYRLNVVSLKIPPLRERAEDLPELIELFLQEFSHKYEKPHLSLPHQIYQRFLHYDWPGNIRQLRNMVERYVVLEEADLEQLPITSPPIPDLTIPSSSPSNLKGEKSQLEKERIMEALQVTYGNKSAAAKRLGISRANLYQKLKAYQIKWNSE